MVERICICVCADGDKIKQVDFNLGFLLKVGLQAFIVAVCQFNADLRLLAYQQGAEPFERVKVVSGDVGDKAVGILFHSW